MEACGIGSGQACSTSGPAPARRHPRGCGGRVVVASDLRQKLSRPASAGSPRGVDLEWVVADAQALPFEDGSSTSSPLPSAPCSPRTTGGQPRAAAGLPARWCNRDGQNFTPEGGVGEFFGVFAPLLPLAPQGSSAAGSSGADEEHVRKLFGDGVASLELTRTWLGRTKPGRSTGVLRLLTKRPSDRQSPALPQRRAGEGGPNSTTSSSTLRRG